jgi:hypothetical protein
MTTCLRLVSYLISIYLFVASGTLQAIGLLVSTFDINAILRRYSYSECHAHVISAYGFNYGRILFPVVLSTLEYININNGNTSSLAMSSVSPLVKENCVAHIIIGNFPLDLKHIVRNGIVNRFQLAWKLEYYWGGFGKWPNGISKEFYYKEASSSKVYLNIVTEDVVGWKKWMHILHNARWPVFHKVIYHFLVTNGELVRAIVCHNCNEGSSTLLVIEDERITMSSLDSVFNSVQIHKSNGLPLLTSETLRGLNIKKLPMSLIPEPEDLLLNSANNEEESDDWQIYIIFAKLVYRGCANATLNALAITKAPDVYSFIQ